MNKPPIIQSAINNINSNNQQNGYNPNIQHSHQDSLQNHMHHLQQQNNVLKDIENRKFIEKSQELYQDDEYDRHAELDIEGQIDNNENINLLGNNHQNPNTGMVNNNHGGYNSNTLPLSQHNQNSMTQVTQPGGSDPNMEGMDSFNTGSQIPANFMRNHPNTGSNRPYSEIYGYGGSSAANTHTTTLPINSSQISNSQNYADRYGYGGQPNSRSQHNINQGDAFQETTLI